MWCFCHKTETAAAGEGRTKIDTEPWKDAASHLCLALVSSLASQRGPDCKQMLDVLLFQPITSWYRVTYCLSVSPLAPTPCNEATEK